MLVLVIERRRRKSMHYGCAKGRWGRLAVTRAHETPVQPMDAISAFRKRTLKLGLPTA